MIWSNGRIISGIPILCFIFKFKMSDKMTPALSLLSLVDGLDGENTKNLKIEEELFPEQLNARREEPDH